MATTNPFPGLRSFDYEENHLFFGREKHINDLLKKLSQNHFVAIVGTSGSGKSSLVRAGLLPAIHSGKLSNDGSDWLITTLKPGNTPVRNLAESLISKGVFGSDDVTQNESKLEHTEKLLQASRLGLVQAVRGLLPANKNLLILLDQFEETFRYSGQGMQYNDEDATLFVNLIIDAVKQRDVPIYVVLTIRSDFLGDCARFEELPEAINDGHYLVPRLTKEQNKMAITGPVNYAQGKISPRLVQRVINDLGDNPDQLPILQHALMRTWEVWKDNADPGEPMDIRHYEMIGGMEHALSKHADEAFFELDSEVKQKLAAGIFKCLTIKTGENRGVRRPTTIANLMHITSADFKTIESILYPFRKSGRTFILPAEDVAINEQTIIDISHESLMRAWERLKIWVDEEAESAGIYSRLCEAALLYKTGQVALWRNPELQMALDWNLKVNPNEAWALQYNAHFNEAMVFLNESNLENIANTNKINRRNRIIRLTVIAFLAIVSVLSAWALLQTKEAKTQSKLAESNRKQAVFKAQEAINQKQLAEKAKEMALEASRKALDAKSFAELQSQIAVEQKKMAYEQKLKAEQETMRATTQQQLALQQKNIADLKSAEALRQKNKADSASTEARRLRLIAISQNVAFRALQEKEDNELSMLLAHEAYKLSKENGGNLNDAQLYSAMLNAALRMNQAFNPVEVREREPILAMTVNGNEITTLLNSNNLKKQKINSNTLISQTNLKTVAGTKNTAYLNSDGSKVVIGFDNNTLANFDSKNNFEPVVSQGHDGLIRSVAFCNDGITTISGGRDSAFIIWKQNKLYKKVKCASRVRAIALGTDNTIYVGCENGMVYQSEIDGSNLKYFASGKGRVQSISCSGKWICIGYSDGQLQVANARGQIIRTQFETAAVDFIAADESSDLLITGLSSKKVHIFRVSEGGKPIEINCDQVITGVELNGDFIFVSCADNTILSYPVKSGYFEPLLSKNLNRKLTLEEWQTYIGRDVPYEK